MKFNAGIRILLSFIIGLASCLPAEAQLCQGSLGDPVVNITFGSGANFGPALNRSVTNYNYISGDCPTDGFYTIANSTNRCFNGSWHSIGQDHTPNDVDGYMMVANASFSPGDFYVDTVKGLCSGITYEFAAWLSNIQLGSACRGNPIKPNVSFKIETTSGTVLLSKETGDIPFEGIAIWKQYGSFFTMPENTTAVVIRMTNNSPGGCGNDVALDDITFRPCGGLVSATIEGTNTTRDVCFGEKAVFTFQGNTTSGDNISYQWQTSTDSAATWKDLPGANTNVYKSPDITTVGTYLYRLSVSKGSGNSLSSCRVASNILTISINPIPSANAMNNGPVCEGRTLTLTASAGATHIWSGPNNFTANTPVATISGVKAADAGTYYITETSDKGCRSVDSTTVIITKTLFADAGSSSVDICEGQSVQLRGSGTSGAQFIWSPGLGLSANNIAEPVATPMDTTVYILTVSNGACQTSDTAVVNVFKKPVANAGPDHEILQGESVILSGSAVGTDVTYFWSPSVYLSNTSFLQPVATPPTDTTFTLNVVSNKGCGVSFDEVRLKVYKTVTIPNAFSPNGDGINDVWQISQLNFYPNARLLVFNRYGTQVYSSKGTYQPWKGTYNGTRLPSGTYYYTLDLGIRSLRYSGWVLLLQ